MCGGSRMTVILAVGTLALVTLFVLFMRHQADEDRCEKHEDEGLQNRHKHFEKGDQDRTDATDEGDPTDCEETEVCIERDRSESEKGEQERVAGDHVGKESNRKSCGLHKDATKFDEKNDWDHKPEKDRSTHEFATSAQVFEPSTDAKLAEALNLHDEE